MNIPKMPFTEAMGGIAYEHLRKIGLDAVFVDPALDIRRVLKE